jgi:2-dehydropantoate 2-reductase
VVGAGALGLSLAARLWRAGAATVVVTRTGWQADLLRAAGITVEGDAGLWTAWPEVVADAALAAGAPWVLVTVKSGATETVLERLDRLRAAPARLGLVQNGLDGFKTAADRWPGPVLAVVAGWGARRRNPVTVQEGGQAETTVGPLARADRALAETLACQLGRAGIVARAVADPWPAIWRKLCVNAAINPLGALLGRTNGELLADRVRPLLRRLAAEAAAVAGAAGYGPGGDIEAYVESVAAATSRNRCSMLQDLEAGRPTELEAILGAVLRAARERGVATPTMARAYALLRRRVDRGRKGNNEEGAGAHDL